MYYGGLKEIFVVEKKIRIIILEFYVLDLWGMDRLNIILIIFYKYYFLFLRFWYVIFNYNK